jgi:hypothetical protein
MPWAANNRVSTSPIEGGIEITDADYQAALEGIMEGKIISIEGGEFALVDPPPAPEHEAPQEPAPPTLEDYRAAIRAHVDATAQARNYDNAVSCASYVNSTNPQWTAEAQAFVAWRDAVWEFAFAELDKVQNSLREQPTVEQFVAELTAAVPIEWPV